jgi:hypothetical protein
MSHLQFQRQRYIREFQSTPVATTAVDTAAAVTSPDVKN